MLDEPPPGNEAAPERLAAFKGPIGTSTSTHLTKNACGRQVALGVTDAVRHVRAARNFLQMSSGSTSPASNAPRSTSSMPTPQG